MKCRYHTATLSATFAILSACGGEAPLGPTETLCQVKVVASGLDKPFGILVAKTGYVVSADGKILTIGDDGVATEVASVTKDSFAGLTWRGTKIIGMDNRALTVIEFDPATWSSKIIASNAGAGVSIEVDGEDLIFSDYNDVENNLTNRLVRVHPNGTLEAIASMGLGGPAGIVVEGDGYLVTDFAHGRLLRVGRSGEVSVLLQDLGEPVEIRKNGNFYYIADYAGGSSAGRILKVSLETGEIKSLDVSGLGSPSGLIIDDNDLLTTDLTGGRLLRLSGCLD